MSGKLCGCSNGGSMCVVHAWEVQSATTAYGVCRAVAGLFDDDIGSDGWELLVRVARHARHSDPVSL